MANKEKLKGGLANLLSGADQSVSKKRMADELPVQEPDAVKDENREPETSAPMEPTTQPDGKLIDTIEDPELREILERRMEERRKVGRGRPRKNDQLGRRMDGYDRTSLIINKEKWEKLKEIAFRETITLKEIVELALDLVIERYESKHGEVKPEPDKRKRDINEIFQ